MMDTKHRFDTDRLTLRDVTQSLVVLTGLCITLVSAWVVLQPPAESYEVIYDAYPVPFWGLLVGGLAGSFLIVVCSAVRNDGYWKIGATYAGAAYLLYLLLPLFRGWALYGRGASDVLTHVGLAKEILEFGTFSGDNFYPGVHLLLAELHFAGMEMRALVLLFTVLFMLLYLAGVYLLVEQLTGDRGVAVAALAVAIVPLYTGYHHGFLPAIFSFMLLPMLLFLVERYRHTGSGSYLFLGLLLSAAIVLSHPVTALYAIVFLVVGVGVHAVDAYASKRPFSGSRYVPVIGFLSVSWLAWYAQFPWLRRRLLTAVGVLEQREGRSTVAASQADRVGDVQSVQQFVVGFVEGYGPVFVVFSLAAIASLLLLARVWRREFTFADLWLPTQYAVGIGIGTVAIFRYVVEDHPIRNSRYAILVATLLAGVLLYFAVHSLRGRPDRRRKAVAVCIVLALLATFPVAVMNSYGPWTHLTYAEEDGTEWLADNHDEDHLLINHGSSDKMLNYLYGGVHEESISEDIGEESPMPKYFGYETNDRAGEAVGGQQTYLVTKEFDVEHPKVVYEHLREEEIVYDEESLETLENDPSADRIYDNDGYEVWFVNGLENADGTDDADRERIAEADAH